MKKIIEKMGFLLKVIFTVFLLAVFFGVPAFAQVQERFEDKDLKITSKLYPTYLGWNVHSGSTTQTVPFYYKITATVNGIGETKASPVTTAYTTYSPTSSTNSLRLKWSPVTGATSYTLYRSVDNSSFYFLTSTDLLTFVDDGDAAGSAFSAASPRGGNLTVENDVTIGGESILSGAFKITPITKAVMEAIVPDQAGQIYGCSDCNEGTLCISTSAKSSSWVQVSSRTMACN